MDIHRPKAIHGWREFAKEVGIIVLGVVIALGGEQIAERVHEWKAASEAREAIREELALDLSDVKYRENSQACIERRLDEISDYLKAKDQGHSIAPPNWVGRPRIASAYNGQWLAATQSGRASLLDRSEAADYANLYYQAEKLQQLQDQEQQAWAELRTLERLPELTPEMVKEFQTALSRARYDNWRIKIIRVRMEPLAKANKLPLISNYARPGEQQKMPSSCIPIATPAAKAIEMLGASFGDPD